MCKRTIIVICFVVCAGLAYGQTPGQDSMVVSSNELAIDTSIDYDDFFNEFDLFLDSILTPRSYFLANLSVGQGYFNFTNKSNTEIDVVRKYTFSPSLGYYGKKGFGFAMTGNMIRTEGNLNLYQVSLSPSFDYLQNRDMTLGFAYTRYIITKDSLPFYVSPLQNEINGYFLWRESWLQPGIAASFGWGNRTEYERQLYFITRLQRTVLIGTTTEESVADFSLTASVKHDFYWRTVLSGKDYIKLTPQLVFSSGTQKFGFNQTGTYRLRRFNVLLNSGNANLDNEMKFQPISLTLYLRTEYSLGKFFIQPQVLFDYYFPAKDNNFTTLFSLNTGFMF